MSTLVPMRPSPTAAARPIPSAWLVAEAVFDGEEGSLHERLDWVCGEYALLVQHTSPRARLVLRLAMAVVLLCAPLFVRPLRPFKRLAIVDRVRALSRMERSWLAAPLMAVKAVLCVLYYEYSGAPLSGEQPALGELP